MSDQQNKINQVNDWIGSEEIKEFIEKHYK